MDRATAARTIAELRIEIVQLEKLEALALKVRRSGTDKKWEELSQLLQNRAEFDTSGSRRKLVLFTEHRDTLNYLAERIRNLIGRSEAVVTIYGGMGREERRKVQEAFTQDPQVQILVATDAAGEGINLQRAHLMVNYDLPWNPNRLEQRFGRIHRIGQTEVCHLWNLVAEETREGQVYSALLRKLNVEQQALGGKVFDVLGQALGGAQLRELLIRAIRLVDESDGGKNLRLLAILEHVIQDGSTNAAGQRRTVSHRMQYVEIEKGDKSSHIYNAGYAPYLNYRPITEVETTALQTLLAELSLHEDAKEAISYAIRCVVPKHLQEVKQHREELIDKTLAAVKDRLTKEINYWDCRAEELKLQEQAGKANAKINSARARVRADELQARLQKRMAELEAERHLSPLPPQIVGEALVVPRGLLQQLMGSDVSPFSSAQDKKRVELLAMAAVMEAEQRLGYEPVDVSQQKLGYDIESRVSNSGRLRFIEVKGRISGADTVTVTKNEILTALNKPEDYILALVEVPSVDAIASREEEISRCKVRYVRQPFHREPDFGVTSINYSWRELWERGRSD